MKSRFKTWWTRPGESAGGIPAPLLVRLVPSLGDLDLGECTFVDAPLEELKRDDHFHPTAGTPACSNRHRMLNKYADGGREQLFWMRLA